jgi:hypothetical protein
MFLQGGGVMRELNDYQKLIIDLLLKDTEKKILDALKSIGFPNTDSNYKSLVVDLSEVIKIREILDIPSEKKQ